MRVSSDERSAEHCEPVIKRQKTGNAMSFKSEASFSKAPKKKKKKKDKKLVTNDVSDSSSSGSD